MSFVEYGKLCKECNHTHLVKSLDFFDSLSPSIRKNAFKTEHRLWKDGYLFSLNIDPETTLEFYSALSIAKLKVIEGKPEEEKEELCRLCHKSVSKEESEQYLGCHRDCYTLEFE